MPRPVLTLITYQARPGSEEQLAGLLRTRIARLRELGLIAERPTFAAQRRGETGRFVESFWWAHEGAPALAEDHSEVQELWMRVEDLCAEGGIETAQLDVLE
jgi:hypothetical protein